MFPNKTSFLQLQSMFPNKPNLYLSFNKIDSSLQSTNNQSIHPILKRIGTGAVTSQIWRGRVLQDSEMYW